MKFFIVLNFFVLLFFSSSAQMSKEYYGCWRPEKYMQCMQAESNSICDSLLFPVEGFEINKSNVWIKTYRGEINTIHISKINSKHESYNLPFFYQYLNLKYIPSSIVQNYANAKVSISCLDTRLVMTIDGKQKKETIYFIKSFDSEMFK